jgi:hypothetical protein
MATKTKKTYYPSKTFDDDLAAFAALYQKKGWSFSGVDTATLLGDPVRQRDERLEHDRLETEYLAIHTSFGEAQEERYLRFAAGLNAARGAFRKDKAVMAELAKFKRSIRRTKKPKAE